jgi:hypothetical protein
MSQFEFPFLGGAVEWVPNDPPTVTPTPPEPAYPQVTHDPGSYGPCYRCDCETQSTRVPRLCLVCWRHVTSRPRYRK